MTLKHFFLFLCFTMCSATLFAQKELSVKLDQKNYIKEIAVLENGEKNGLFFKYRRNGKHKSFMYENGKKRKLADAELSVQNTYDPQSKGQILEKSFGIERNGKREGLWLTFNSTNKLIQATLYNNGSIQDTKYRFHPDGELLSTETYAQGRKHGISREFHAGGALHYEMEYKNGKLVDGAHVYYYPNGVKKIVNHYKNGVKYGKSTTYYKSGAVEIEGEYSEKGLPQGPWKEYYENGTLKEQYHYKHGVFHGEYTIYDEQGNVEAQYIYKNDKLIKTIVN